MSRNHNITSELFHLLEPDLTSLGFKYLKTKRAAICRKGNINYSIGVNVKDESIWNGGSDLYRISFSLYVQYVDIETLVRDVKRNAGVLFKDMLSPTLGVNSEDIPPNLIPEYRGKGVWHLTSINEDDVPLGEIRSFLHNFAIPFFEQFSDVYRVRQLQAKEDASLGLYPFETVFVIDYLLKDKLHLDTYKESLLGRYQSKPLMYREYLQRFYKSLTEYDSDFFTGTIAFDNANIRIPVQKFNEREELITSGYFTFVLVGRSREHKIWHYDTWHTVYEWIDNLLMDHQKVTGIRTIQLQRGSEKIVGINHGRLNWDDKSNLKWTLDGNDRNDETIMFLGTEIWAPRWTICTKESIDPFLFMKLENPFPLTVETPLEGQFNQYFQISMSEKEYHNSKSELKQIIAQIYNLIDGVQVLWMYSNWRSMGMFALQNAINNYVNYMENRYHLIPDPTMMRGKWNLYEVGSTLPCTPKSHGDGQVFH